MAAKVDKTRLWQSLMDMGKIGETPKGGSNRVAFTELDRQGRELFRSWAEASGCSVSIDGFGNMFACREGRNPGAPVVMTGSHLDTQLAGGKFDGVLGVLAGLEAVRAMNDAGIETEAPIEIVNWTNEEGYIFHSMIGSEVWTGRLDLDVARALRHEDGWSIGERLDEMDMTGAAPLLDGRAVACYIEVHIEQGPILEDNAELIGVVDAAQGFTRYAVTFTGQEAHAGPTPMRSRKDALFGLALLTPEVEKIALRNDPGRGTIGWVRVFPNSTSAIPGVVECIVDLRHPDGTILEAMAGEVRQAAQQIADARELDLSFKHIFLSPARPFNGPLSDRIEAAARSLGMPYRRMYTGAGHDACNVAWYIPTAMIFAPCRGGISHNEAEWAEPEACAASAQVLTDTLIAAANGEIEFGT